MTALYEYNSSILHKVNLVLLAFVYTRLLDLKILNNQKLECNISLSDGDILLKHGHLTPAISKFESSLSLG